MKWYSFGEAQRRRRAPDFRLTAAGGQAVTLDDYRRQHNLVLFFTHNSDCASCEALMRDFAARRADYRAQDAQVVAIVPATQERVRHLQADLNLSYPLLADPQAAAQRAYMQLIPDAPGDKNAVFVIDRYGAPYAALVDAVPDDPAVHEEILDWLGFIEVQCPECGIAEWPVGA
jgi:peroxiredoxin